VSERMRRVNESLRKVLADGVERLGDPSIAFVTITGVRATTDFSQATVYVSVLGSLKRRERSLRALERAHGVLQQGIARELRLRRTPQLIFQYDETVDRALRMNELLDQVAPELAAQHVDTPPDDRQPEP
jgi:ribosome-binding factor A